MRLYLCKYYVNVSTDKIKIIIVDEELKNPLFFNVDIKMSEGDSHVAKTTTRNMVL